MGVRSAGVAGLAACVTLAAVAAGLGAGPASAAGPGASTTPAAQVGQPLLAAQAAPDDRGTWSVTQISGDTWEVSWTSPTALPLTGDRPRIVESGRTLGPAALGADQRTLTVTVVGDRAPDPDRLDVLLAGDRIDAAGRDGDQALPGGSGPDRAGELLADDPGEPGPYAVTTSDYELDPLPIQGFKKPVEMVGHVVEPAAEAPTGSRPLVVLLHGRHEVCYGPGGGGNKWPCVAPKKEIPSQLGYDYLQRLLASQGYATVSIRANGINAQDFRAPDGGAAARAQLIRAHLDHWQALAGEHQLDLDRVVLVGHSRGGEGVDRAAIQIPADADYRVAGQVLIAPTDFAEHTAPYIPTVTLLPYCDGDVADLQGQRFTDTARDLDVDDPALKSSVLVMGANHNYFNTEWTPGSAVAPAADDWFGAKKGLCGSAHPDRLSAAEQQAVGATYVAGAVGLFTAGEQEVLPLYDGSDARVASTGDAVVLSHAIGGGRETRRPDVDMTLAAGTGEQQLCVGHWDLRFRPQHCGRKLDPGDLPHWTEASAGPAPRTAWELEWSRAGQTGALDLGSPLPVTDRRLELRTIVDQARGPVQLKVRLTDGSGRSVEVTPVGGGELTGLPTGRYLSKKWAQTLIVEPPAELAEVTRVELVGESGQGRLFVLDVSAAPDRLADVPDRRLPVVSIGNATVTESAEAGPQVARLPLKITGEVTEPAKVVVTSQGSRVGQTNRIVVDIAPGQREASVPIGYQADPAYSLDRVYQAQVWPLRGAATDRYIGRLRIVDQADPPVFTHTAVEPTVAEGESARVRTTMSVPLRGTTEVRVRIVRGTGEQVRVGDVSRSWLKRHRIPTDNPALPLYRAARGSHLVLSIDHGDRSNTFPVPVVKDKSREGIERLTLRLRPDYPGARPGTVAFKIRD